MAAQILGQVIIYNIFKKCYIPPLYSKRGTSTAHSLKIYSKSLKYTMLFKKQKSNEI